MPSTTHQALVELFRVRPTLAIELVERVNHAALPTFVSAASTEATLDQLVPVEFRADLVVDLIDAEGAVIGAVVVEVQLGIDLDKTWTWPLYVAALRARKRCPVWLLVVAPDEAVANWARTPIELSPGRPYTLSIVLGPRDLSPITEPEVARMHPELALLSAVAYGHRPEGELLIQALPAALSALDVEHRAGYLSMLFEAIAPALRLHLEALLVQPWHQNAKLPPALQQILDEAAANATQKSANETAIRTKAEAVLSILAARGVAVSDEDQTQILACTDVTVLDRWIRRASTLKTVAAVLRAPRKPSVTTRSASRR